MADPKFHLCTFLHLILGFLSITGDGQNILCPSACSCLGSMVDCSKRGLIEVPKDIPEWATILELQSNAISSVPTDAFKGLPKLAQLDLSNNQLLYVNTSCFEPLGRLKELKMNYNKLSEIPLLPRTGNLTRLELHHNLIHSIRIERLTRLPNLRHLDLNFNKIVELTPGMFPKPSSLHQLSINNNKIINIENGAFDNLTSLESLKLSKNRIKRLSKDVFLNQKNLKHLELNRNKLTVIGGLWFQHLKNLVTLKLRRNQISSLQAGAFFGLEKIQNLQLDQNNISIVDQGWLYGLTTLQKLNLAHNSITTIKQEGWDCVQLHELDLKYNLLTSIQESTFERLKALKYLYLDHNKISYIAKGAFKGLQKLQVLELNDNEISWTIEDMDGPFTELVGLNRLGLGHNHIKSISKQAFSGLTEIRQLLLADNAITSIQSNAFEDMNSLQVLKLNSTSLLCDCKLSWLPVWLRRNGFEKSVNVRCGHPEWLEGKSIFEIDTDQFTCTDFPKPIMIREPEDTVALKGENATIHCVVASSSTSQMTAQWKKDGAPLIHADIENYESTTDGKITNLTSILNLKDVGDEHKGQYQCIVQNEFGAAYSQKVDVTVHVFPKFLNTPVDVTVKAGSTARLECAATGDPPPEMAWQKDGGNDFPAARERRMLLMTSDVVFFIVEVKSVDQGLYSCMATNDAGTIIANASLTVLETPSFVEPMVDKSTKAGETTVIECLASGSPKPKLTWFKDGLPLQVTQRHFFTAEDQLLVIVQTEMSDSGAYTCEMSNTLGTKKGTSNLSVSSSGVTSAKDGGKEGGGGLDDKTTTIGIIIIAVVCCVVGTSLVWVIIIYRTRKNNEEYSSTPTDETTLPPDMPHYHPSSDEERGSSKSDQFLEYQGHELPPFASQKQYGKPGQFRTAAIFPSDVEDDDHRQSVPLTSDEHQPAADSENSINSLPMPNSSASDSSPSTRSTSSTGLNSLSTFHPQPRHTNHDTLSNEGLLNSDSGEDGECTISAMVHQPAQHPHSSNSLPRSKHMRTNTYHGGQPPGAEVNGIPAYYEAMPTSQPAHLPHSHYLPQSVHTRPKDNCTDSHYPQNAYPAYELPPSCQDDPALQHQTHPVAITKSQYQQNPHNYNHYSNNSQLPSDQEQCDYQQRTALNEQLSECHRDEERHSGYYGDDDEGVMAVYPPQHDTVEQDISHSIPPHLSQKNPQRFPNGSLSRTGHRNS